MIDLLPAPPLMAAFLAASLLLAVTPGPGVFYIVTRTLSQGRSAGLASVAGVAFGNFGNAVGAAIGLAAVLAVSYVLGAGAIAPMLARSRRAPAIGRYLTGGALIGLGLFTAFSGSRADAPANASLHTSR